MKNRLTIIYYPLLFSTIILVISCIFFVQIEKQSSFAFEENILALQTGIISTDNQDYAISQDFETRVFQNGKIIRLSGITTTGEYYYLYQKNVNGDIIVKGKILSNNVFIPIVFKESAIEQQTQNEDSKLIMVTKLSSYTYSNYPFVISVKVFDSQINQNPKYDSRLGVLQNVLVNVDIKDRFGKQITKLTGKTNSNGVFQDKYVVLEDVVDQGEYKVVVTIDDGKTKSSKTYTTFFRGDIRDYFHKS